MRYLPAIFCLFILISCSLKYETSMCRHRAVECALVYGEKVGNDNVGIAIGPSSTVWHAQAYAALDEKIALRSKVETAALKVALMIRI